MMQNQTGKTSTTPSGMVLVLFRAHAQGDKFIYQAANAVNEAGSTHKQDTYSL